jgi:hypothetical protein
MVFKIIYLSDELFQGYNIIINTSQFESINELINYFKNKLITILEFNNLFILSEKVKKMNLHIHDYKFYNDILNTTHETIYICSHEH